MNTSNCFDHGAEWKVSLPKFTYAPALHLRVLQDQNVNTRVVVIVIPATCRIVDIDKITIVRALFKI